MIIIKTEYYHLKTHFFPGRYFLFCLGDKSPNFDFEDFDFDAKVVKFYFFLGSYFRGLKFISVP
jgi:hypothetical protein